MIPFDVVTSRYGMISNSGGVTNLSKIFSSTSFSFTDVERITIPATGFANNVRFLRAAETIFVRKERLNSASVLKNNPEVDKALQTIFDFCERLKRSL